jgi:hypothetical protein
MMIPHVVKNLNITLFLFLLAVSGFCAAYSTSDTPFSLVIYPKEGIPGPPNQAYPASVTIDPGDTLPLVAKVFDRQNIWLSQFETDTAPITWKIVSLSSGLPCDVLTSTIGFKTSFIATSGYNACRILATFSQEGSLVSDTVVVATLPRCCTKQLTIEASPDFNVSPNSVNRLGTIRFWCQQLFQSVYAIIRDQYGNYVSLSGQTVWQSRDTSIAEIAGGGTAPGEGIIRCKNYGSTWIFALDSSTGPHLFDSVQVLCPGACPHLYQLQIAKDGSPPLESLILHQGSSTTLHAQAARIDSAQIVENVPVYWAISGDLHFSTIAPENQPSWTFSALDIGTGWIKIHAHSENAIPDSIPVTVVPAMHSNDRSGAPILKILVGNRSIGVPGDASSISISGFDLRGRLLFKQERGISDGQLLQRNGSEAPFSGVIMSSISFKDSRGNIVSRETVKSLFRH